jgi:hypothetical protein
VNIRIALANTKKGNSTIAEYFAKMKALGDETVAVRRRLDDEELVEYVLTRLGEDYTSLVTNLTARVEPITVGELYSQLLNFETCMDLTYGGSLGSGSVNAASRGRGSSQEEEATAKEDTAARTISVAVVVHQHVVTQLQQRVAKGAAGVVGTTTTTTVRHRLMVMNALYAKFASSSGTRRIDAGTGSMRTTCRIRS